MTMTVTQAAITIALAVAATMLTRFLPFLVFREGRETPKFVTYLGEALPAAVFALLVVYCFRNVTWTRGSRGIPEIIALAVTVALHWKKHNMMLSMAGGTICYMLLIQLVFG